MKRNYKVVKILVAVVLVLSMTTGIAMASIGTGIVKADSLRLRSEPNTTSKILGSAPKNSTVDILEELSSGWYKVSYKNQIGYMSGEWLTVTRTEESTPSGEGWEGVVRSGPLNVRSGPGTSHKKITTLPTGTAVTVLGTENGWYRIVSGNISGYVHAGYVDRKTEEAAAPGIGETSSAEAVQGRINHNALNVRTGPGTKYTKIGTLPRNTLVTILGLEDGWYQITSDTLSGYVHAGYVVKGADPIGETKEGMIIHAALNVRTGPGTKYTKVGTFSRGTVVQVHDKSNGWYKVSKGSLSGYVHGDYVVMLDSTAGTSQVGQAAAAMATSLLGCRYVYGAEGPNTFDCSGLSYYIFKQLGYTLSRGSSGQYRNNGVFVSPDDIQPGDLVFFFDPKYDGSGGTLPTTHMGMYVGNNQFIHASTVSYKVQYNQLYGSYYENYIVGFKRIG